MSTISKRALVNFVVDSAIALAFLVSAVSGLVFLAPAGWLTLSGSATTALGVGFATWRTLHDWAAVIMIAGVVLHVALHWRWVTTMVRRLAVRPRNERRHRVERPVAARPVVLTARSAGRSGDERDASVTSRDDSRGVPTRNADERRGVLTRNAFLKRAGVIGATALVGGIVGRSAGKAAISWFDDSPTDGSTGTAAQDTTTGLTAGAGAGSSSSGSGSLSSGQSTQTVTTARVVIDSGRCTGCGRCLQTCPSGVFAASGSQVIVSNPDSCRLCGRCVQGCEAGAITLNG